MASYFLPSFLTGWDLSAVSAYSLSANLQKRILSYLLKRTLGHLVDGGHLDLAQIDAGIGSGRIEVRNIQLHAEAINRQLPSIPFTLVSGEIGRILIQLPVPNFWSGELSVTVSDIKVNIKPLPQGTTQAFTTKDDLAASFASAASQIFVEDEEAKEIEESIHESLASEDDANAQQHAKEESGSLIATYVEALLTRLKVTIDHVHVKLDCDTIDLSLKLESATVHSSNARSEQRAPSSDDDSSHSKSHNRRLMSETARTLQLQGFELWLEDKRKPKNTYDHYSSSSSEASSDDFTGEESQEARQQLEESVASLQESSASLYESAVGSSAFHDAPESHGDALPRPPTTRSAHSIEPTQRHLLFSLGQEAVVVTLKTVKERQEMIPTGSTSRRAVQRLVSITTDVDVQIGHAGAIVFIDHASPLMTIARRLAHSMPSRVASQSENTSKAERSPPPRNPSVQRKLELSCHVSSLNVIVGYEASTLDGQVQSSIDASGFGHRARIQTLVIFGFDATNFRRTSPTTLTKQVAARSSPRSIFRWAIWVSSSICLQMCTSSAQPKHRECFPFSSWIRISVSQKRPMPKLPSTIDMITPAAQSTSSTGATARLIRRRVNVTSGQHLILRVHREPPVSNHPKHVRRRPHPARTHITKSPTEIAAGS